MQIMREHRMAGLVARGFLPVSGDVKTSFGIFHNPADGIPKPYCHLTKDGKLLYSEADPRTKSRGKRTPKKERNTMNGITPEMLATMVAQAVATAMAQNGGNGAVAGIGPKAVAQPKPTPKPKTTRPWCNTGEVEVTLPKDDYKKYVTVVSGAIPMEYRTGKDVRKESRCVYNYNGVNCFVNIVRDKTTGEWVARMLKAHGV